MNLVKIKEPLALLLARQEFTLLERRIYWAVLKALKNEQTVDKDAKPLPVNQNKEFKIHISELFANDVNPSITDIRRAAAQITSRKLISEDESGFGIMVPFPQVEYDRGWITVLMLSTVVPHFINLSRGYSQYQLRAAISLTSEYAQLLYPRLCRFLDTGFWKVDLAELRPALNAEKYVRYSNFKQRVLNVALKEINERTDISVDARESEKQGKAIIGLTFIIRKKHDREEEYSNFRAEVASGLSLPLEERRRQVSEVFRYYKFTKAQQRLILEEEEKLNAFIRAESYVAQGVKDISDPTAYIAASVFGKNKKAADPPAAQKEA